MKVHIKNMVCDRCKMAVENILESLAIDIDSVQLGEVDFGEQMLDKKLLDLFQSRLEQMGFGLINDKKSRLIEGIKSHVISLVQRDNLEKIKLSVSVGEALHHDYNYLSNLFSSVESITVEHFFILQKIEKTKELLVYDELTLTEIAYQLGYSSVAHLSRQFSKITGLTPSRFKSLRDASQRQSIDSVIDTDSQKSRG